MATHLSANGTNMATTVTSSFHAATQTAHNPQAPSQGNFKMMLVDYAGIKNASSHTFFTVYLENLVQG